MTANLKAAAVKKLELLGLSPADISAIKQATPSRWMRAPISGIVVTKLALRGAQVNAGGPTLLAGDAAAGMDYRRHL